MNMNKYYNQLVGAKIIGFRMEDQDFSLAPFPVFTLELDDEKAYDHGVRKVDLALSMDEEGNGGGFGFIEVVR